MSRARLQVLLFMSSIVWGVILWQNGQAVSIDLFKPFSSVVLVVGLMLVAFDRVLWRVPLLYPWFVTTPNIHGTWRGEIHSDWINGDGAPVAPIVAYLVVRQRESATHLVLMTEESTSETLNSTFEDSTGGISLISVYRNTPRALKRDDSPIHFGGFLLNIPKRRPFDLNGEYWTDRKTKGELHFLERSRRIHSNFASAENDPAFVTTPPN